MWIEAYRDRTEALLIDVAKAEKVHVTIDLGAQPHTGTIQVTFGGEKEESWVLEKDEAIRLYDRLKAKFLSDESC